MVNTTWLSGMEKRAAISLTAGWRPWAAEYSSIYLFMAFASAFIARDTFMLPSSRMNRFISPAIMGTAYVEKRTP